MGHRLIFNENKKYLSSCSPNVFSPSPDNDPSPKLLFKRRYGDDDDGDDVAFLLEN